MWTILTYFHDFGFWGLGAVLVFVCFRNNPELRGNSQYGTKNIFLNHLGAICHPDVLSGYFPQTRMVGHNPANQWAGVTTCPASSLLKIECWIQEQPFFTRPGWRQFLGLCWAHLSSTQARQTPVGTVAHGEPASFRLHRKIPRGSDLFCDWRCSFGVDGENDVFQAAPRGAIVSSFNEYFVEILTLSKYPFLTRVSNLASPWG